MIKKFLFAISAVALLTACGGNAGETSKAEGSNEAATEQTADNNAATGDELTEGPGTIELADFSVDVPEGWKVLQKKDKQVIIGVDAVAEKVDISVKTIGSAADAYDRAKSIDGVEDLGEKTYGDNKFLTCNGGTPSQYSAYLDGSGKYIAIKGSNVEPDNELLQKVLASINVK